jgi:hypothetical protein
MGHDRLAGFANPANGFVVWKMYIKFEWIIEKKEFDRMEGDE